MDAIAGSAQQGGQRRLAGGQRIAAQVGAVQFQQVEAEKLNLAVMTARVKPVEVAVVVRVKDHALAIDHEPRGVQLAGRLNNEGEAVCPLVAIPRANAPTTGSGGRLR